MCTWAGSVLYAWLIEQYMFVHYRCRKMAEEIFIVQTLYAFPVWKWSSRGFNQNRVCFRRSLIVQTTTKNPNKFYLFFKPKQECPPTYDEVRTSSNINKMMKHFMKTWTNGRCRLRLVMTAVWSIVCYDNWSFILRSELWTLAWFINRPGVAGAVLHSPLLLFWLIN